MITDPSDLDREALERRRAQPTAGDLPFCADCNGNPDDGGETDLRTADDCGAGGRSCGASACQVVGADEGAGGGPGLPPAEGTGVCEGEVVVGRGASTVFLSLTVDAQGTRTRLAVVPASIINLVADADHLYRVDAETGIGRTRR